MTTTTDHDSPGLIGVHHIQLACPAGSEDVSREFYVGVLGMDELIKPPVLAARGGAWFRAGAVELHLGVEQDFRPARKAHPGLLVADLPAYADVLAARGVTVTWDDNVLGLRRCHLEDPHGNRLELIEPIESV